MSTRLAVLGTLLTYCMLGIGHACGEVTAVGMEATDKATLIQIYGDITQSDVVKIATAIKRSVPKPGLPYELYINLDSGGGDVESAIAIGRLIRMTTAKTNVMLPLPFPPLAGAPTRTNAVCASACVLVLVAGSERAMNLRMQSIGIHRPYSTNPLAPGADSRAAYAAIAARVKSYLDEMAMPGRLYEAMMEVPPEEVRWLSSDELIDLRIFGSDPAYADLRDSRAAAAHGISKQDWLRRKALATRSCEHLLVAVARVPGSTLDTYLDCTKRVEDTGKP